MRYAIAAALCLSLAAAFGALHAARAVDDSEIVTLRLRRTPLEHFDLYSEFEISKQDLLDMRRHLNNVRRSVGQDLAYFPDKRIEVVLSQAETFHTYTKMPGQVTGLFDGRIHLPLPSAAADEKKLQSVLWHEYTHAVIYQLSGGRCPLWLNEGLAVYEENRILKQDLAILREAAALSGGGLPLALNEMDGAFAVKDDAKRAKLAYEQAYVFADYLFSRYSRANVRDLLIRLGEGVSFERALKEVTHLDGKDLEGRWRDHMGRFL